MSTPDKTAAFFDLDRTLIAGSSAFVFARAAYDADLIRPREFIGDAIGAVKFRLLVQAIIQAPACAIEFCLQQAGLNKLIYWR